MAEIKSEEDRERDLILRRMMAMPHKPHKPKSHGGAKAKASRKRKGKRA
jgi:hypothetical protein